MRSVLVVSVSCREMFMPRVELILTEFLFLTELTEFFRQRLKDRWFTELTEDVLLCSPSTATLIFTSVLECALP